MDGPLWPNCPKCGQAAFTVDTFGVCLCHCGHAWQISKKQAMLAQEEDEDADDGLYLLDVV
jgi:hypothetical protein